jgi:hypothetical protein
VGIYLLNEQSAYITASDAEPTFWDDGSQASFEQYGDPGPWDTAVLAGIQLPGYCAVRSPGKVRKMERLSGPGYDSEELQDAGAENAEVAITCYLWMADHLIQWRQVLRAIEQNGGTRASPKALDVYHPGLAISGITSLYIYQVSMLEPSQVRGVRESTILGREFMPRLKGKSAATVKPIDGTINIVRPTAFDERVPVLPPSKKDAEP